MAGNSNLNAAARAKKDEFYTQLPDIEQELRHYRRHFKGKTVLCNCDDPFESNFFKYFALNFNKLGLNKLIATSYAGSPIAGTQMQFPGLEYEPAPSRTAVSGQAPYKAVVTHVDDATGDGSVSMLDIAKLFEMGENSLTTLDGDGDFRSRECLELLEESDVVCTNPPFSLFREYMRTLIQHHKQFLIIGSQNGIKYREIFPLFEDNRVWLGYHSGHTLFEVPDYYEIPDFYDLTDVKRLRSNGYKVDENGKLWRNLGNICWFTNLDIKKRHEYLILIKRYKDGIYPKYCNYDAIEVSKVSDIPCDYSGAMGVPISFMEKYNPNQFEIIGYGCGILGQNIGVGDIPHEHKVLMAGHSAAGDLYYMKNGKPKVPYARILIRNKHPEEPL